MAKDERDRGFMARAVEIMKKSRSEHDDRPDPAVGAVIVDRDGELLGEVARAQNRVGNHAEFYLIEKKLGDRNLEGCTLYATLEPCAGQRGGDKKPCAEWIINARIATVVVGIMDPHPDYGGGVKMLLDAGIEVRFFDKDLREEIKSANKPFLDQDFAEKGIAEEFPPPSLAETEEVASASTRSFSSQAIAAYLKARGEPLEVPSDQLWDFFRDARYISPNYKPTVAGIVLFGKRPDVLVPQSILRLERDVGGSTTVDKPIRAPLALGLSEVEAFFKEHMLAVTDWDGDWDGLQRSKRAMYPIKALREAVVNAVAHRSYHGGARVHVRLHSDRVVVMSPGLPVKPVTIRKMQAFRASQYSRNPVIANALFDMGYMDERGKGLSNMKDWLAEYGLPPPIFTRHEGYLVVTINGRKTKAEEESGLNNSERVVLALITRQQEVMRAECESELGVSESTTLVVLKSLRDRGLIVSERRGRKFYYRLA
jgi:ATP-dependent DNA helicase RecG